MSQVTSDNLMTVFVAKIANILFIGKKIVLRSILNIFTEMPIVGMNIICRFGHCQGKIYNRFYQSHKVLWYNLKRKIIQFIHQIFRQENFNCSKLFKPMKIQIKLALAFRWDASCAIVQIQFYFDDNTFHSLHFIKHLSNKIKFQFFMLSLISVWCVCADNVDILSLSSSYSSPFRNIHI